MILRVMRNDCTKSFVCAVDRPILKRQVCDVVLVYHAKYWFLLNHMIPRIAVVSMIHGLKFPKSVVLD
jgi:hypothetical protein